MPSKDHSGREIRRLLSEPGILIVPGAYDALTARLIKDAGFPVVYATGAGISNTQLGLADKGLLSFGEIVQQVGRIIEAVDGPVIVDADTGFGGPANVIRTVKELSRIGAGGIQLEDQVFPKQCGHFDGKSIVSQEEMVGKIQAALDARFDEELVIIARTDSRESEGLNAAIDRAQVYADAGADMTFIEAPLTRDEMARIPVEIPVPQIANMVEGGKTPLLDGKELAAMGFKMALFANCVLRAGVKGIQTILSTLHRDGTTVGKLNSLITMEERNRLTKLDIIEGWEKKYGA